MKLQAPYSGGYVEADGELAERLIANGYKKAEQPKKTPRKRPAKKEQ